MTTICKIPAIVIYLTALVQSGVFQASGADAGEFEMIRPLHVPIVKPMGYVEMWEVPVGLHGAPMNCIAAAMCAPIFAGSATEEDSKRDINLVSLSKISVRFENPDQKSPLDPSAIITMIIDVSHFSRPKESNIDLFDIAQTILVCVRIDFPPGILGKVNIKFVGANESMGLSKLEGSLWVTSRDKLLTSKSEAQ